LLKKRQKKRRIRWVSPNGDQTEPPLQLLRTSNERPGRRTAEKCDELAPSH
jgi:hypothetical protein